jgi:3-hydroxyethyl bacteriochlorophyllide a dehydrogenase
MNVNARAVVLERPEHIQVNDVTLAEPGDADVVVQVDFSGISTGTEKLLYTGRMPTFPGMGYPLVPGYESVGRVVHAGPASGLAGGESVYVPGARCFGEIKGLFGGSASKLVVPGEKVVPISDRLGEHGILLALAATAYHAVAGGGKREKIVPPDLIVGHGVLGRLLARLTVLGGHPAPTVWETNPIRQSGAEGYPVVHPDDDDRRNYSAIYDVSGDASLLDTLVMRLAPGGEIVLAGFYTQPLSFLFAPAFMREATIRCAAEWKKPDMLAVRWLMETGHLSLDGLITHRAEATRAPGAYPVAFDDADCLKMVLDWRHCA